MYLPKQYIFSEKINYFWGSYDLAKKNYQYLFSKFYCYIFIYRKFCQIAEILPKKIHILTIY